MKIKAGPKATGGRFGWRCALGKGKDGKPRVTKIMCDRDKATTIPREAEEDALGYAAGGFVDIVTDKAPAAAKE